MATNKKPITTKPLKTGDKVVLKDPKTGKFLPGHPPLGGRPRGAQSMTTLLKYAMEHFSTGTETKFDELIIRRSLLKAAAGDNEMIKLIFNRIDGKEKEHIIHDMRGAFAHGKVSNKKLDELLDNFEQNLEREMKQGYDVETESTNNEGGE